MRTLGDRMDARETVGFDYLRIVLALAVMFWHAALVAYGDAIKGMANPYALLSFRPVLPLFFALSGFLVSSSLNRLGALTPFLVNRGLRIAPALFVEVVFSALILGPLLTAYPLPRYFGDPQFADYFKNVIGWVHFTLPGVFADPAQNPYPDVVNVSLWTVPFELECYLALSAVFLLRFAGYTRVLVAALVAGMVVLTWRTPLDIYEGGNINVPARMLVLFFLAGAIVYQFRHRLPSSPPLAIGALAVSCVLLTSVIGTVLSVLPIAYCVATLGCTNAPKNRLLRSGDYSYGIYLYAFPIQQATVLMVGPGRPWLCLALSLLCVAGFAAFSWHFVEKPVTLLKARLNGRKRARAGAENVATAAVPIAH